MRDFGYLNLSVKLLNIKKIGSYTQLSIRRFILILAYPKNVRCVYVSNALIYGTINGKVENTFNFT